jgi:hypothetical protein
LALIVLWLALLCLRPDAGLRMITASSAAARLLRRLLPAIVALPLVLGWFAIQGYRFGLYSEGLNIALFALSNVIVFGFLLFGRCARCWRRSSARRTLRRRCAMCNAVSGHGQGSSRR